MDKLIETHAHRHPGATGRLAAFLLGWLEGRGGVGMTYDDDSESPRSRAYDRGRRLRQRRIKTVATTQPWPPTDHDA